MRALLDVYSGPDLTAAAKQVTTAHLESGLSADDLVLAPVAFGASSGLSRDSMLRHFAGRYPVYYGAPQDALFVKSRCERLGIARNDVHAERDSLKYVVGGPVWKYSADGEHVKDRFSVIHAYAPNLESGSTADARLLLRWGSRLTQFMRLSKAATLDEDGYRALLGGTLDAIAAVAARLGVGSVAMPLLGQGAFLSAVGLSAAHAANAIFAEELQRMSAAASEDGIEVVLFVTSREAREQYTRPGVSIHHGSLFEADTVLDGRLAVVNAWDDQSLIGNGLDLDPTIDGWLVSGASHGSAFVNSSFAHNVVLLRAASAAAARGARP